MFNYSPLSEKEKQQLCDLIRSGMKYADVATKMGLTKSSVSGYAFRLKKYGLKTGEDERKEKRSIRDQKIRELREQNVEWVKIAEILGDTLSSVKAAGQRMRLPKIKKNIIIQEKCKKRIHEKHINHVLATVNHFKKTREYNDSWNYIPKIGISLLDIKSNQCHFPCKDGLYCGGEIRKNGEDPLRHYCEEHYKIMTGGKNE